MRITLFEGAEVCLDKDYTVIIMEFTTRALRFFLTFLGWKSSKKMINVIVGTSAKKKEKQ